MGKWVMPVLFHMFVYILKDAARVWWNNLPKGVVLNYEDLKRRFRTHFNQQKKQTKTYLAINGIKRREGESNSLKATTDSWTKCTLSYKQKKLFRGSTHYLHGRKHRRETTKGNAMGTYRKEEQRKARQIKEAVKSGRLAHLIKGIRKGKSKQTDTQLEEWITPAVKAEPITEGKKEPILTIGVVDNPLKRKEPPKIMSIEEMIFPPIRNRAPSVDPILISVKVYGRQIGRVQKEIREGRRDVYTTLFRHDTLYHALHSLIPIKNRTESHYVRILGYKKVRAGKRLKESPLKATLQVSECLNLEEKVIIKQRYPEQMVTIRSYLPAKFKQELIKLLRNNADVFAWQYSDMARIPQTLKIRDEIFVTEHKLNEDKKITPVQQKKRGMAPERSAVASKEVEELKKAEILRETRYQTWVANTVMVKKTDGAWRMCVDFKDINKACPKDCYSLLEID
ncbi:hypothetical protein Tco_1414929 [Tanacetum coccineum]